LCPLLKKCLPEAEDLLVYSSPFIAGNLEFLPFNSEFNPAEWVGSRKGRGKCKCI
jgi:hypothetical protein